MDDFIADTAARIYQDHADDSAGLWQALEENGLTRAWVPESLGGTGLELSDGFGLIRQSAGERASVPFAETLMAGLLLSAAGAETPDGQFTLCPSTGQDIGHAPFVDTADYVLRLTNNKLEYYSAESSSSVNSISRDHLSAIDFSTLKPLVSATAPTWLSADVYHQLGALTRAAQLCGAMERQLVLTLEHTSTREQFGRPLTKFQAVQHLLAEMAGEIATSAAALEGAIHSLNLDSAPDFVAVASAKIRASEAAEIVAKNAHQAHGAIGFTGEYALGEFSRRVWQWREDFGSEFYWAEILGQHYMRPESEGLTEDIFGAING